MQELARELRQATGEDGYRELRDAAKAWSATAIDTYDGVLLQKAFAISSAIATFLNEIEQPESLRS